MPFSKPLLVSRKIDQMRAAATTGTTLGR